MLKVSRTRIKICGLTRAEDAAAAVLAGADALGVIFAESPRKVSISQAREVLAEAPPAVARVGVFVDADPAFVAEAVEGCGLTAVQLHGDETVEYCRACSVPVIKVFGVGTVFGWDTVEPYRGSAAAVLLDSQTDSQRGGTGKTLPWIIAAGAPGWAPVFLAGGLKPGNVAQAIAEAHPYAVDVSSGVESSPGIKDHDLIRAFTAAVRAADEEAAR